MEEIASDAAFKKYIGKINKKHGTNEAYKFALAKWSTHIQMMPVDALKEAKDEQRTIFEVEDRKIDEYFATFRESLEGLSSNTQSQIFNNVKAFYKRNGVVLGYVGAIKTKVVNDYRLSTDEIRHALKVCESVRNRAMILVQATSGCGTSEVLSIKTKDFLKGIDSSGITIFHPTRAKTEHKYTTCCSPEATEAVKLWLREYDGEYLFPLKPAGVKMVYKVLSKKAGFEKKVGDYAPFHSHGLRKWHNTTLSNADCPHDILWFWNGRQENTVQKAYVQWNDERHLEVYKRYVEKMSIVNEIHVIDNSAALEARIKVLEGLLMSENKIESPVPKIVSFVVESQQNKEQ